MWGHFSYLLTTLIFAGTPLLILMLFGFHFYKRYLRMIVLFGIFMGIITPFVELPALLWNAWAFSSEKSLGIYMLQTNIETIICSSMVSMVFMLIVLGATACQDKKEPILRTAMSNILKGTYALWRK